MHYIHQFPALQGWVTPMYSQVTAPRCQPWTHQPPGKCSSLHVPCGIPEDVGCKNPLLWFAAAACRVCACLKHRENVCRSCLWLPSSTAELNALRWKNQGRQDVPESTSKDTAVQGATSSHPGDSSPTLHRVLMNLRAFSPQDLLSLHPLLPLPTRALTRLSCWNDVALWLWVQLASSGKSF